MNDKKQREIKNKKSPQLQGLSNYILQIQT